MRPRPRFAVLIASIVGALAALESTGVSADVIRVRPSEKFRNRATIDVYSANQQSFDSVDERQRTEFVVDFRATCTDNRATPDGSISVAGTSIGAKVDESETDNDWYSVNLGGSYEPPGKDPVQACNVALAQRVQQGADRSALLRSGFATTMSQAYRVDAGLSCQRGISRGNFSSDSTWIAADVNCIGSNPSTSRPDRPARPQAVPAAAPARAAKQFFDSATVVAEPENYVGACPARVRFTVKFKVNRAGRLTYQWVGEDGFTTESYTQQFARAGEFSYSFTRTIRAPASTGSLAAGAGARPRHNGFMRLRISIPQEDGQGRGGRLLLTDRVPFSVTCGAPPPARTPARAAPTRAAPTRVQ